jgi:CheY-like chemotaxis protein
MRNTRPHCSLRCADATRAFRAWERDNLPADAPRLPVYCITANVLEEHRQACETAGMVRWHCELIHMRSHGFAC